METLLLPFSPRYIILTICAVVTVLLTRYRALRSQGVRPRPDTDRHLRRPHSARHSRSDAKEPRGFAELSDLGASALPAGRDQAGDAAVLLREREGRHAVFPRHPRRDLSARQDGARQAAVRHPGGRLPRGLRVDAPFDGAEAECNGAIPRHHRRTGLRQAVFGIGVQYFGDEFWRAQSQRGARAERGRQKGRLRA